MILKEIKSKGYEVIVQTPIKIRAITNIHIIKGIALFAIKTKKYFIERI